MTLGEDVLQESTQPVEELVELERALERLEARNERLVRVVECRFFGGMSVDETAEALSVGRRTVERDWTRAKAYLYRELKEESGDAPGGGEGG